MTGKEAMINLGMKHGLLIGQEMARRMLHLKHHPFEGETIEIRGLDAKDGKPRLIEISKTELENL
jgi:actin-like ATPase involved in cell morphogenesis